MTPSPIVGASAHRWPMDLRTDALRNHHPRMPQYSANGMPIFVDIGSAYPSDNRVTLVIWAEHYDDFAEMLNAVDHGGAWLSVSSYLDVYEGSLQMNSDNGCEYTWWTEVG